MIFILDDDLIASVKGDRLTDVQIRMISRLCDAHINGNHMLFFSYRLGVALSASLQLSQADRGVVRTILGGYAFIISQIDLVKRKVVIHGSETFGDGAAEADGIISLTLESLSNYQIGSGVNVFFEHTDDEAVYTAILERVRADRGLSGIALRMIPRGGGGSSTYKFLRASLVSGEIAVSVVDSDRKTPFKPDVGQTAKKVEQTVAELRGAGNMFCGAHVVDVHEVENLIPIETYRKICGEERAIEGLDALYAGGRADVYLYFDFKKGFRPCDISGCQYMKRYWGEVTACAACTEKNRPECFLIPGIGDGARTSVRAEVIRSGLVKTGVTPLYEAWAKIFDFLLDWCVAAPSRLSY